jgi:hypothetical protein
VLVSKELRGDFGGVDVVCGDVAVVDGV